jgi:invasion protein IalB
MPVAAPQKTALFQLGQVCATPGAIEAIQSNEQNPLSFVRRHVHGDWSELCEEDQKTNQDALTNGARIFSAYELKDKQKIWVITESDRSVTTVLLPSEY